MVLEEFFEAHDGREAVSVYRDGLCPGNGCALVMCRDDAR